MHVVYTLLNSSLLVQKDKACPLYVNFDPMISSVIRETECLVDMKVEIPHSSTFLMAHKATLKDMHDNLQVGKAKTYTVAWKESSNMHSAVDRES